MEKRVSDNGFGLKVFFLAMVFVVLSDGKKTDRLLEIDRKLKQLNKPSVKSIQSEDGDIIDCVDIYKQPAFDHPALKNHTIQMRPTDYHTETTSMSNNNSSTPVESQVWQRSGSCPKGTIPIRRIRKQDLLRATSLENYGRKYPYIARALNGTEDQDAKYTNHSVHLNGTGNYYLWQANRSASFILTNGYNYIGAKGDINVWNPSVESWDEYSSAQIWLKNGDHDLESVESGWVVNPRVYGDKRTRFFGYWTVDSSQKTGCFDLTCPGFVHTSEKIALGASIDPISSQWGTQYHIEVYIRKDSGTGNWWLLLGEQMVGYWPANIFYILSRSATLVQWGGEVYSSKVGGKSPHTATTMGSGQFASSLYRQACYVRHIRIRDWSMSLKFPEYISPYEDEYECYSGQNYRSTPLAEPEFYFGGPGRNPRCP